eukprot:GGOE01046416.1.p1 GENE.GGOE01046416.1~~GGOE01046416.1.p1  ORF type:complete len:1008 (-),score=303.85 GGOE01046416.1:544-3567(-)
MAPTSFDFPVALLAWPVWLLASSLIIAFWVLGRKDDGRHFQLPFPGDDTTESAQMVPHYEAPPLRISRWTLCFSSGAMETLYWHQRQHFGLSFACHMLLLVCGMLVPVLCVVGTAFEASQGALLLAALVCCCVLLCLSIGFIMAAARFSAPVRYVRAPLLLVMVVLMAASIASNVDVPQTSPEQGMTAELSMGLYCMALVLCQLSGSLKWCWATALSALFFLGSVVLWAAEGRGCLRLLCDTSYLSAAPWLLLRCFIWCLCLFISYRTEYQDRSMYKLRRKLEGLCLNIARMDGEACMELLADDDLDFATRALSQQLRELVDRMMAYRPFLPPGLFAAQISTALPPTLPSTWMADPLPPWRMADPLPPDDTQRPPSPIAARTSFRLPSTPSGVGRFNGEAAVSLVQVQPMPAPLTVRYGTVLALSLPLEGSEPDASPYALEQFLGVVEGAAQQHHGVVQVFGVGSAMVTWNLLNTHPYHQNEACHCALQVHQRLPESRAVLVSGAFAVGILGTDTMKAPVLHGPALRLVDRLGRLHGSLQSPILATESVYEAVQDAFSLVSVDHVLVEGQAEGLKLYSLLDAQPLHTEQDRRYKEGFSALLSHRFHDAEECFTDCLRSAALRPQLLVHARRMLQSALAAQWKDEGSFLRHDRGWEPNAVALREQMTAEVWWLLTKEVPFLRSPKAATQRPGGKTMLKEHLEHWSPTSAHSQRLCLLPGSESDDSQPRSAGTVVCSVEHLESKAEMFVTTSGEPWDRSMTLIGAGGFGEVYLGMNQHGGLAAVKRMPLRPDMAQELLTEVQILSEFRHDNIVAYLGIAIHDAHILIVMEFVPCGSLATVLLQFGMLRPSSVRRYARDILRGLAYLHSHSVLHRDIKPANVLLDQTGHCKLADFGTAAIISTIDRRQTDGATVVGTPAYMAPEVLRGQCGAPADLWALGVTCFQLLTGQLLFQTTNAIAMMFALGTLEQPPSIPASLPREAQAFLRQCLALAPEARGTADGLLQLPFLL